MSEVCQGNISLGKLDGITAVVMRCFTVLDTMKAGRSNAKSSRISTRHQSFLSRRIARLTSIARHSAARPCCRQCPVLVGRFGRVPRDTTLAYRQCLLPQLLLQLLRRYIVVAISLLALSSWLAQAMTLRSQLTNMKQTSRIQCIDRAFIS